MSQLSDSLTSVVLQCFVVLLKPDLGVQQNQIHNCQRYEFGHTMLRYLSRTLVFIKTKFTIARDKIYYHFVVILKSHLRLQQKEFHKYQEPHHVVLLESHLGV
jgi:hypothetical protein